MCVCVCPLRAATSWSLSLVSAPLLLFFLSLARVLLLSSQGQPGSSGQPQSRRKAFAAPRKGERPLSETHREGAPGDGQPTNGRRQQSQRSTPKSGRWRWQGSWRGRTPRGRRPREPGRVGTVGLLWPVEAQSGRLHQPPLAELRGRDIEGSDIS